MTPRRQMTHVGTKPIETERLLIRRFTVEDAPDAYRNWCHDEAVTKFLTWPLHASVDVTRKILEDWVSQYEKDDYYHWAIELKEMGEPIGSIGAVHQDERVCSFEIGYCIGSIWWGLGITSEALAALLPFFFDEVHANRVESRHDPNNYYSGKVMLKCGMRYEGTRRQADFNNTGVVDACMYGIVANEYYAKNKTPGH